MARSYGRLFPSFWEDFRPYSIGAKVMYGFLITQTDLDHSGIISWRPQRWALDLGEPEADVRAWLKELDQANFIVIDEEWQELLIRSLIRRDEIWKLPNVFKSACGSAMASKSRAVKGTLYDEIKRIDFSQVRHHETRTLAQQLLTVLEPFANPSTTPPRPSRNSSETAGQALSDGSDNGRGTVPKGQSPEACGKLGVSAADTGYGTVPEPSGEPFGQPHGVGEGNGPVLEGAPTPTPTPSSVVPAGAPLALWPSAVPDLRTGEGEDRSGDEDPGIDALVAEVRRARPAWSTKSILRALTDPSVAERPWPAVRSAMLAVAADRESQHPGRLAHDGPWWADLAPEHPGRRGWPPWCQAPACNERTRRLEDAAGRDAGPCPDCHPLGGAIREAL